MSSISKTTVNLPVEMKKELKKMAIDEDISLSGLIIKMIEEGYEKRTGSPFQKEDEESVSEEF